MSKPLVRNLMAASLLLGHVNNAEMLATQAEQYRADIPKTVLELQQFRESETAVIASRPVVLVNLNPRINAWFAISIGAEPMGRYHLENADPRRQAIHLSQDGLEISTAGGTVRCPLFGANGDDVLEHARQSSTAYVPVCQGYLYLRNRVAGRATALERATEFLRSYVPGGEAIIGIVRQTFYGDRYLTTGKSGDTAAVNTPAPELENSPIPAQLAAVESRRSIAPDNLGIALQRFNGQPGRWYPVAGLAGVYGSYLQPRLIATDVLASYPAIVNRLDDIEGSALAYLIAFDLAQFDVGFSVGTNHPQVGWSDRVPESKRDRLPGPDGTDTVTPLAPVGMVSPVIADRVIATFAGGFKRDHGAFRYGALAERNHGSHYGFIEQGVVFSKLVAGLATFYALDDGSVNLKTWEEHDNAKLPRIRFARQNGVPVIERRGSESRPGALVGQWGAGNWSGSPNEKLRSLRAGLCLQDTAQGRFLIYAYFSDATPSAMARVFQAYGCSYAMHLDMNALEHTYLAVYLRSSAGLEIEHLVQGMDVVDKTSHRGIYPRFLAYPDNRDFFFIARKDATP